MTSESIPDFLSERAAAQPERLAVVEERPGGAISRWSYAELNDQVNRLANALTEVGVTPGDRVLCDRIKIECVYMPELEPLYRVRTDSAA